LGALDPGSTKSRMLVEFFDCYLLEVVYAVSDKLQAYTRVVRSGPVPGIELTKGRGLRDRGLVAYGNSSVVHSEVHINFD
jgi:hypothetical protein